MISKLQGNLALNFGKATVVQPEDTTSVKKSFENGYVKELKDAADSKGEEFNMPDTDKLKSEGEKRYNEYIVNVNKVAANLPDSVTMTITPGKYGAHTEYDGFPVTKDKSKAEK